MDDFDDIYLERQRVFDAGKTKGIQEANARNMQEMKKEGNRFGSEFCKQLAMYESYLQVFFKLNISEHLKNPKLEELVMQMKEIIESIDYKALQMVKSQRQTLEKKFQLFMAMLGIRKDVNRELFEIKKSKESFDF